MKVIKAYQCSYCTYYRKTKRSVVNHESKCFQNPKNKACASCDHNVIDYETFYNPFHGGDPGSTDYDVAYNWCNKKHVVLDKDTLTKNCPLHSNQIK